ncbi:MAG: type III secretion protein V [Glomeribacter sp. 1016415]|nr:type III secretion protein V [Glomeribacter sp. 1016415]
MLKSLKLPAFGEVGIALLIIAIISLMILPLPPMLIDGLLAINISISVTLLMVTMYIPNIVSLSSFPSLLLFTTLYRLALNIASTKSILLHADAGHIIESFGQLVVGGNLMVGMVVFIIITTVQFIVIAKGSERVAEVSARFTLDAMPGKQMSIDADLRANAIDADEARKRRAALAMESKLHGGMDGAMKFVKGDAVAGLVITLINIIAGIIVGITYHDMEAGEAANRFSVLSIGDAMVSQIPSLLISVAAGVIITRVADDLKPEAESLGDEIGRQLSSSSRALYLASLLLLGFALVPGFPAALFVIIAIILSLTGYKLSKRQFNRVEGVNSEPVPSMQRAGDRGDAPSILPHAPSFTSPVGVRLAFDLAARLAPQQLEKAFNTERKKLQEELGLPFPGITMWRAETLPSQTYEILLHDVPQIQSSLPVGKVMLLDPENTPEMRENCEALSDIGGIATSYWLSTAEANSQTKTQNIESVIAHHVIALMYKHANLFIGIQETQWILDQLQASHPGIVAEVQKVLPPQRIAEVLRRMLEEHVPIRNVRNIMESLIHWGPKEKDLLLLTEYVRGDLSSFMAYRAGKGAKQLAAILFEMSAEQHIRQAIKQTPTGNYLALPPEHVQHFITKIKRIAGAEPRDDVVLVTSMDIRRYIRRMIENHISWLPVYSYQELGEHINLQPIGRISV